MMLAPQLDDLLELRHQAHALGVASRHPVNAALSGLYASVFRGQGLDFEEVREYRHGDEIRNMDWRVTARTGRAHLKVFREERQRTVVICVDTGPHMRFGTRGTFKSVQAARAAALLAWSAAGNQDRVGGLLFGDPQVGPRYFRPSRARRSLWRMLHALTEPGGSGPLTGDPLVEALQKLSRTIHTGSVLFIIADLNRDYRGLEQVVGCLRLRHEVVLLPVDDPADWEIPAMGRVVFSGSDGDRMEVDTDNAEGRRLYRQVWERSRHQLRELTTRLDIDLIPVRTNGEIHETLIEGLRQRAHRLVAHR